MAWRWAWGLTAACVLALACPSASTSVEAATKRPAPAGKKPASARPKTPAAPRVAAIPPMRFLVVRSSLEGCGEDCPAWISAEGEIKPDTAAKFRSFLARLGKRKLPVLIHSPGGSVEAGYAMGDAIRKAGLDVAVSRTWFAPCPAAGSQSGVGGSGKECRDGVPVKDPRGLPDSNGAFCASACVFAFAGGTRRVQPLWAGLGVHRIERILTQRRVMQDFRVRRVATPGGGEKLERKLIRQRTVSTKTTRSDAGDRTYRQVTKFFEKMGVDPGPLITPMRATAHTDIHWLTQDESNGSRLVTGRAGGESLLAPVVTAPAPVPVPVPEPDLTGPFKLETTAPGWYMGKPVDLTVTILRVGSNPPALGVQARAKDGSAMPVLNTEALVAAGGALIAKGRPMPLFPFGGLTGAFVEESLCQNGSRTELSISVLDEAATLPVMPAVAVPLSRLGLRDASGLCRALRPRPEPAPPQATVAQQDGPWTGGKLRVPALYLGSMVDVDVRLTKERDGGVSFVVQPFDRDGSQLPVLDAFATVAMGRTVAGEAYPVPNFPYGGYHGRLDRATACGLRQESAITVRLYRDGRMELGVPDLRLAAFGLADAGALCDALSAAAPGLAQTAASGAAFQRTARVPALYSFSGVPLEVGFDLAWSTGGAVTARVNTYLNGTKVQVFGAGEVIVMSGASAIGRARRSSEADPLAATLISSQLCADEHATALTASLFTDGPERKLAITAEVPLPTLGFANAAALCAAVRAPG